MEVLVVVCCFSLTLHLQNFDIIGFDPRGINNTRPLLACFPDHLAAAAHAIEESAYGWPDTSSVAFDNLWAMKRAFSEGCSERAAKEVCLELSEIQLLPTKFEEIGILISKLILG